jgi:sec-independent protein translocase protein TatB
MFDIGWSEMAVIAVVALIVLGPKEIPNALKTAAHWMRTARKMAREFQSGVDQIVREAELDEARKTVTQAGGLNLGKEIEKVVDPTGETKRALNTDPTKAASTGAAAPQIAAPTPAASPTAGTAPAAAPSSPPSSPAAPPASGSSSAIERSPDASPEPAAAGERRA